MKVAASLVRLAPVCLALWAFPAGAQQMKIGTVDMVRLFKEYYKTDEIDRDMKEQRAALDEEEGRIKEKFKGMESAFKEARDQSQNKALSDKAREEKKELAESKLVELKNYEGEARKFMESRQKQLGEMAGRASKRIAEELRAAVQDYGRKNGYTLIFDQSGRTMNQIEAAVYADERLNVTDEVLKIINRDRPKAPAAKKDAPAAGKTP